MKLDELLLETPYLALGEDFYRMSELLPLDEPYLVSHNADVLELLDVEDDTELVSLLNGVFLPQGAKPFSMAYAGHQFGNYNPWLGDGRVAHLGKAKGWNLQLKGSGESYYARSADGRATLRSSIREYLMSEAMFYLGVPTTRALGVIGSKTKIARDNFEVAAITMRLAKSWVRFGHFEYFYYQKEYEKLEALAEYVIEESYPHLKGDKDRFFKMFSEVVERTAKLIASWQGIGFCHGVMNTDNMSIDGVTIDYGPFAMLDDFSYSYVCNHTDRIGRYAYGEQPNISYWNLTKLSTALSPLIDKERMQKVLDDYGAFIYPDAYIEVMRQKLGLEMALEEDIELIQELVGALQDAYVDFTLFFRTLSRYDGDAEPLYDIVMEPVVIHNWLQLYDKRLEKEQRSQEQRQEQMLQTNPKYILKNYMLQEAIDFALRGDFSRVQMCLDIAKDPYGEQEEYAKYHGDTPEFYKNIGLSCSS